MVSLPHGAANGSRGYAMPNFGASFDSNERKIAILLTACLLAVLVAAVFPSGGHLNVW